MNLHQPILTQTIPILNPLNGAGNSYSGGQINFNVLPGSPTSTPSSLTPNTSLHLVESDHSGKRDNSLSDSVSEPSSPNDEDSTPSTCSKKAGRRKIKIEFIEDKNRRHITFSKRKSGIMKKAYELSTLTGTQVLLLVASETGHVYTFATPKLQPLISRPDGKNLIQSCLNTPDQSTGSPSTNSLSRISYNSNNNNNNHISNSNCNSSNNLLGSSNGGIPSSHSMGISPPNGINSSPPVESIQAQSGYPDYVELISNHSSSDISKDFIERSRSNLIQSPIKSEYKLSQQQLASLNQPQYIATNSPNFTTLDPYTQSYQGYYQIPRSYISNNSASTSPLSPQYSYMINQYPTS